MQRKTLTGLVAWGMFTFLMVNGANAQVVKFVAPSAIVDGKNFVLGAVGGEFLKKLAEIAKTSPEKWVEGAQGIFMNMVFVSAAEIALIRAIDDTGSVKRPVEIRPADFISALLTWDTADDDSCITPTRLSKGERTWSDVILFSGDREKLVKITGSESVLTAAFGDPRKLEDYLVKLKGKIQKSGRQPLIEGVIKSGYFDLQHFLLLLKADLLTNKDPGAVESNARKTAARLKLR